MQPDFRDNGLRLDSLTRRIGEICRDSGARISSIGIKASASPDGALALNRNLSRQRAENISALLKGNLPFLHDTLFNIQPKGIDWSRLDDMVSASDMPHREEVLQILRDIPETTYSGGKLVGSRLKRLMDLKGGRPYRYMSENFFPALRVAEACIICGFERMAPVAGTDTVVKAVVAETASPVEQESISAGPERKPFYMSASTNMLYDALLVPNIGVEFYLGRNWSVAADWMYGWWDTNRRHRYWRVYGGEIALRRWFGSAAARKPLTGHHAGIYVQAITYDFEFGGKGQMAGEPGGSLWDQCSFGAGLEYGYSLPVSTRLNIDFSVGIGYFGGKYYEYRPIDGHYVWQSTRHRRWFGPTRAMVSLVWLIGHGNRNVKGGDR